jgi:hypothetical protein
MHFSFPLNGLLKAPKAVIGSFKRNGSFKPTNADPITGYRLLLLRLAMFLLAKFTRFLVYSFVHARELSKFLIATLIREYC